MIICCMEESNIVWTRGRKYKNVIITLYLGVYDIHGGREELQLELYIMFLEVFNAYFACLQWHGQLLVDG